jgi:serine protease inhibitor
MYSDLGFWYNNGVKVSTPLGVTHVLRPKEGWIMRRVVRLIPVLIVCIGLVHCGTHECLCPTDERPRELTQAELDLVGAYNEFGFSLFRKLVEQATPDSNVIMSPASVSMALGMTLNGAAGTTEEAMKATLEFDGMSMLDINQSYRDLIDLLTGLDESVQFEIANSIWYRLDKTFEQDFFDACSTYFDAQVAEIDFSSPNAADIINAWVSDKTHGRIDEIIDGPISGAAVMFLINAIYFLGTWTYQFDPALTKDDVFGVPGGTQVACRMMERPDEEEVCTLTCYEDDEVQIVDLPYGDGWYSMTIVLPQPGVGIDALIETLDPDTWETWIAGLTEQDARLRMPKFELEWDKELNDALIALGMGIAFDQNNADFTRMRACGGLWINRVGHKTFIKVDEAGTEAAAVTVVEMWETTVPEYFDMYINRPFIAAIREHHSGTLLFMVKIVNPEL